MLASWKEAHWGGQVVKVPEQAGARAGTGSIGYTSPQIRLPSSSVVPTLVGRVFLLSLKHGDPRLPLFPHFR